MKHCSFKFDAFASEWVLVWLFFFDFDIAMGFG